MRPRAAWKPAANDRAGHARRQAARGCGRRTARSSGGTGSVLLALALCLPAGASAQLASALTGGVAGAVAGGYVSLAIVVAEARAGEYLYRPAGAGWRLATVPLGAAAGAAIGSAGFGRLGRSAAWGAFGLAAGTGVGALVADALWGSSEDVWAGAVVGGAAGLIAGVAAGALTWEAEPEGGEPLLAIRVPVGP